MCKHVSILLIDDDETDREAIARSFKKHNIKNKIVEATNGEEALKILRCQDGLSIEPPFLILLDLNMPRMNGLEFLSSLREDPTLRESIVFVLTSSNQDSDKLAAYQMNIAAYLVKSNVGKDYVNLISLLTSYWQNVEFPS